MSSRVGLIGVGEMGSALAKGFLCSGVLAPTNLFLGNRNKRCVEEIAKSFPGVTCGLSNLKIVERSDILILAVKPESARTLIAEIGGALPEESTILSVMAGINLKTLGSLVEKPVDLVRAMPNIAVSLGESTTAISWGERMRETRKEEIVRLLRGVGRVEVIPEKLFDVATVLCGSGLATVCLLIEALSDGAVAEGMPRAVAYRLVPQMVLGSARLFLESHENPGALKDKICSPGGVTIHVVDALERNAFRGILMESVREGAAQSRKLGIRSEEEG